MKSFILNKYSLMFSDPGMEAGFRHNEFPAVLKSLNKQVVVAAVFNLIFVISDYIDAGHKEVFPVLIFLRIVLSGMMLILLYIIHMIRDPFRTDYIVFLGTASYSLTIAWVATQLQSDHLTATGPLVVIVAYYVFIPQRFVYTVITGLGTTILILFVYYQYQPDTSLVHTVALAYFLINVFCITDSRQMHIRRRKDYYSQIQEKELLKKLERGIVARNRLTKRLKFLSETDSLTGLKNRRFFFRTLQKEVEKSHRLDYPLVLAVIDVDDFKMINDKKGHDHGDDVLKYIAKVLEESIRGIDLVARIGGEEFVILFPGMQINDSVDRMEKIRARLDNEPGARGIKATISAGVAEYNPGMTADDIFVAADQALYKAKSRGKNRIIQFDGFYDRL